MRDVDGSSEIDGEVAGVATDDVERRDAAMVRRRWDSVLRVADVMQAVDCKYMDTYLQCMQHTWTSSCPAPVLLFIDKTL